MDSLTKAPRTAAEEATLAIDDGGVVRYCSPGAEALFRSPASVLNGRSVNELIPRLRFNSATPGFNRFLALFWSLRRGWLRLEACSEARGEFAVELSLSGAQIGGAHLFLASLRDAQPPTGAGERVRRLTAAVADSDDAVMLTDADGVIEYVNAAFERITGFSAGDALGRTARILNSGTHPAAYFASVWATLRAGREYRGTFVNRRKDGSLFHEEKSIRPMFDDAGTLTHFLAVGHDVTGELREQARLERRAHYDELTGLANRALFHDRLRQALARATRYREGFALLYVDLDNFKALNDGFGHACGDSALQEVARRLQGCLRAEDTVARVGGDEFAVILAGAGSRAAAELPLRKILAALHRGVALGERVAVLGASVGACLHPQDGRDEAALIRNADAAMYRAKARGGERPAYAWAEEVAGPSSVERTG